MLAARQTLGIALAGLLGCAEGQTGTPATTVFDPSGPTANGTTASSDSTAGSGPGTTNITTADDTGTPGGDCCQAAATPGCNDPDTQSCVCTIEPACCQDQWSADCVDLAGMTCGDPDCQAPATSTGNDSSGETTEAPPPTLTCVELGALEGWDYFRCEGGGGTQCNGVGTPTIDCDFCCEICGEAGDLSCGEMSVMQGWAAANCEWNGNGACGGVGTPTCDCNFCCQAN